MFHLSDVMKLQTNEKVLGIFRSHTVALVVHLFGFACLLVLPCFFIFPLFKVGVIGIVIFFLPVIIGGLGAWRAFRLWDATSLILTDRRLVHVAQRGMWDRQVSEVSFSHIGDVQWEKKGFWRSLWGIGSLRIRTSAGAVPSISMTDLRGPERLASSIQELRGHGSHPLTGEFVKQASPEAQRERLLHLITQASPEELERLEGAMRKVM